MCIYIEILNIYISVCIYIRIYSLYQSQKGRGDIIRPQGL